MSNITVVGTGYVGLSNAMMLAKHHSVTALDINSERVEMLKNKSSPIQDEYIEQYLSRIHNFKATLDKTIAYANPDFIIIATPTNYNEQTNYFDTSSIEQVLMWFR